LPTHLPFPARHHDERAVSYRPAMTSSSAAATDEGPATISKGPPPPGATATSAAIITSASTDVPQVAAPAQASVESGSLKSTELDSDVGTLETRMRLDSAQSLENSTSTELTTQPQPNLPPTQHSNEADTEIPIPSPPTVSPLSTPAATHINVDDSLPDDALTKLTTDHPPFSLARGSSIFGPGIMEHSQPPDKLLSASEGMGLAEPFVPDQSSYQRRPQVEAIATTDPDPNGADYSTHSMLSGMRLSQGSIDPSAYIMNLASQGPLFQEHGPSVIDPSAVSLHSFTQDSDVLLEPSSASGSQKLESFARIEFADSTFQMTTYTVIIGRDQQAMNQARADERREAAYRRKCEENERNGLPPPTPITHERGKFSKSYVSEEGGMLGPEHSDGDQDFRPPKKRRPSSAVQSSAGEDNASGDHVQSNRQYVSHTPGAAAVDLAALQTSPEHIPFIGIHSPGPDIASKTKGISRQHLKIQFNKSRSVFEGIALHKNGFFCEDVLYGLDKPATLRSGDRLQIKDVEFFFVINGVQLGMTGGEDEDATSSKRMSVGGKEISLDFEHSDHENFRDTSEELSDVENVPTPVIGPEPRTETPKPIPEPKPNVEEESKPQPEQQQESAPTQLPMGEQEQQQLEQQEQQQQQQQLHEITRSDLDMLSDLPPEFALPDVPRRRGPGRPPKDGIMSKRERRLLKKQMQETSKKTLPQESQEEKIKRPVGRPRKNPIPEDGEREKRKYNKKKREDGEEGSDAEKQRKEKKDKKVRPKSPPLDLRIEDYTTEQLQKPTKNYGVLIDEALTNGPPDGLTLKQIYKRITARYPWFYFTAETKGWESSVRHNLIGNEAFKKDEETGLWSRVPGVELDAGKKRKASSPDRLLGTSHLHSHMAHASYFQNNPYTNPGTVPYARGLPSYSAEQNHAQPGFAPSGQNAQLHTTTSAQPASQPAYPAHTPAPAQLPPGYGSLAMPRPTNTPQQSTYSSPYARPPPPPPPPPTNPPAKPDANAANGQTPTASSSAQSVVPAQQQQSKPSTVTSSQREQLSPEIERAIMQFSANMLNVISKQTPHAAKIIEAAANRVRGLPVTNRVPGFDSVETTLINAMQGMIADMKRKHRHTTSASPAPSAPVQATPTPSPAAPNTVEAEIQRRLRNFRESMVTALKTKTDKAEIIVDSAINRAQGLPHAGKIPGWEEADNLMVKSVSQIIAEARSAHSLKVKNASPAPPPAGTSRTPVSQPAPPAARAEPTPSPAPPQPPASNAIQLASSNTPSTTLHAPGPQAPSSGSSNLQSPSLPRPGMPLQRPAPVSFTRPPTTGSIARPPTFQKDTATASAATSATVSAPPRPNVSSPAPPSAGVLDQITGHRRFADDSFAKPNGANVSANASGHTAGSSAAATNVVNVAGVTTAASSSNAPSINGPMTAIKASNMAGGTTGYTSNSARNLPPSGAVSNPASSLTAKPTATTPASTTSNNVNGTSGSNLTNTVGQPISAAPSNTTTTTPAQTVGNITGALGSRPAIATPNNTAGNITSNMGVNSTNATSTSMVRNPASTILSTAPSNIRGNISASTTTSNSGTTAPTGTQGSQPSGMRSNPPSYVPGQTPTNSSTGNTGVNSTSAVKSGVIGSVPNNSASNPTSSTPSNSLTSGAATRIGNTSLANAIGNSADPTVNANFATPESVGTTNSHAWNPASTPISSTTSGGASYSSSSRDSVFDAGKQIAGTSSSVPMSSSTNSEARRAPTSITNSISNNVGTSSRTDMASTANVAFGGSSSVENKNNNTGMNMTAAVENDKGTTHEATTMDRQLPTAFKAPAPIHNISSPAPPSAGVVDQIAGHKRSLDEGPGSANIEQPEPKRLGISPT
jgi:hypothetical protein